MERIGLSADVYSEYLLSTFDNFTCSHLAEIMGCSRATVNRCVNSSGGVLPVLLVGLSDAVDVGSSVCDLRE